MTILNEIIAANRTALETRKNLLPLRETIRLAEEAPPCRDFAAALAIRTRTNIIAELKKASPSKGLIRPDFHPAELAAELAENGAAALSVLTEEFYFHGALPYLRQARDATAIPILRKDFIFDPYQIYEARAAGADAVLLIAAALDDASLRQLLDIAAAIGIAVLAEAHNQEETDRLNGLGAKIIGINCRDLKTFKIDLDITEKLLAKIPDNRIKVAESGINRPEDIVRLRRNGASAFLIGETIMREACPGKKLRELLERTRPCQ